MSDPRNPKTGLDQSPEQDISSPKLREERKELGSIDNPILESLIANLLNNAPSTQTLNLSFRTFNTDLDNDEKRALYDAISKNKSMKHLTLEAMELNDEDAKNIVTALKKRKSETGEQLTLNYLSLRMNKFTVDGTKFLATAPVDLLSMKLTKLDDNAALRFVSPEAVVPKVELNDNLLTALGVKQLIEQNKITQKLEWDWLTTALTNPFVGDDSMKLRTEIEASRQHTTRKSTP